MPDWAFSALMALALSDQEWRAAVDQPVTATWLPEGGRDAAGRWVRRLRPNGGRR
jgi:hypothetical protein